MLLRTRRATIDDVPDLRELYQGTIASINARDYSPRQIEVWASTPDNIDRLKDRIQRQYFLVALASTDKIVGFASIENNGYLDLLYVHKDYQNRGVASLLLRELVQYAKAHGASEITTEASITAKPFFTKKGFELVKKQAILIKDVELDNFVMKLSRRGYNT